MAFRVAVLRSCLESMERLNLTRTELLRDIIDESVIDRDDSWVENSEFYAIISRAIRLSGDPALGLTVGERGNFTAFGAAGLLFSVVPTFREAMVAMAHFHRVARDEQNLLLREDADSFSVEYLPFDAPPPARQFNSELVLARLRALLAQFGGPLGVPLKVQFDYPAPAYVDEYYRVFGCEVSFGEPRVAMIVDRVVARRQQLLSQPELCQELRKRAQVLLDRETYPTTLPGRVRYHLRESWGAEPPRMEALARRLGISQRSLHRSLAREGLDYRTLLNQARCEVASHLLRQRGSCVKQVSIELGFSNPSSFYRAFKRWMGCSPSAYADHSSPNGDPPK